MSIRIRFWGVRGSIATPGPETAGVGGNTSCVEVLCSDGTRIILDAGTGLRRLGDALLAEKTPVEATILLSHFHWDHIQGLPFFVPAYLPSTKLTIVGGTNGLMTVKETLEHQMTEPVFPVRLDELRAKLTLTEVRPGQSFAVGGARVRVAKGNHPGGVHAYRIDFEDESLVFATDTEHFACVDPQLSGLAEGATCLVYDAQYTPEEYAAKVGWGHSTFVAAADLARAAGVGKLVLFHHDPRRDDAQVAAVEARTKELFASSVAAREGMELVLGRPSEECAAA